MDIGGAVVLGGFLLVVLAAVVFKAVAIVPQYQRHVLERLGRYRRVLQPGVNVVIPFVDRVARKFDDREQRTLVSGLDAATRDNQWLAADMDLFYQVTDPRAAVYEVADHPSALQVLAATTLRNVVLGMDLGEALASPERIREEVVSVLAQAGPQWGLEIRHVDLRISQRPGASGL